MITNPLDAHQLPPIGEIQSDLQVTTPTWFKYPVIAYPHQADYGGIVWHGTYISWMEEARIECLKSIGIEFADLVALGCDLPVVELALRYHQSVQMGMAAIVKARMIEISGVRINWDYQIESTDGQTLFVSARVTLVAVDRDKGKILRQLPVVVKDALVKLSES